MIVELAEQVGAAGHALLRFKIGCHGTCKHLLCRKQRYVFAGHNQRQINIKYAYESQFFCLTPAEDQWSGGGLVRHRDYTFHMSVCVFTNHVASGGSGEEC